LTPTRSPARRKNRLRPSQELTTTPPARPPVATTTWQGPTSVKPGRYVGGPGDDGLSRKEAAEVARTLFDEPVAPDHVVEEDSR